MDQRIRSLLLINLPLLLASCAKTSPALSSTSSLPQSSPTSFSSSKKEEVNSMTLTIEGKIYQGTLEANDSAQVFASLFPVTFTMNELNGNEKYVYLDQSLRKDEPTVPSSIKAGDLMLFSDNCVVLFYQDFQTTYSHCAVSALNHRRRFQKRLRKWQRLRFFCRIIQWNQPNLAIKA